MIGAVGPTSPVRPVKIPARDLPGSCVPLMYLEISRIGLLWRGRDAMHR